MTTLVDRLIVLVITPWRANIARPARYGHVAAAFLRISSARLAIFRSPCTATSFPLFMFEQPRPDTNGLPSTPPSSPPTPTFSFTLRLDIYHAHKMMGDIIVARGFPKYSNTIITDFPS